MNNLSFFERFKAELIPQLPALAFTLIGAGLLGAAGIAAVSFTQPDAKERPPLEPEIEHVSGFVVRTSTVTISKEHRFSKSNVMNRFIQLELEQHPHLLRVYIADLTKEQRQEIFALTTFQNAINARYAPLRDNLVLELRTGSKTILPFNQTMNHVQERFAIKQANQKRDAPIVIGAFLFFAALGAALLRIKMQK